ncbi:hypothetical protein RFI_00321 [Reticulomyxa filosa]|uniref:Uncharacterized protein n=1 Tax=Reticulomyxa filosa TaxID=46433 RepID=X6PEV7_RETFI|nr:hypothetical protein RFI_00321 [Reticulomyxa filosa]|eukprot:ETO36741.1 hypothetical protein RFI_00321 [Reticulomyxa filosa]
MKFRPLVHPEEYYIKSDAPQHIYTAETSDNMKLHSAMVFDNTAVAHRVRLLKNLSNNVCNRGFLAFFIVDPKKPIFSYRDNPTFVREHYIALIDHILVSIATKSEDENSGNQFIRYVEIAKIICEFANMGYRLKEAKKFRQQSIEIKSNNKSTWGSTCYGNSGETKFYAMRHSHFTGDDEIRFNRSTTDSGADLKIFLE